MNKILAAILLLLMVVSFNSCDTTDASTYKSMYLQQAAISDSLQTKVETLQGNIDVLYQVSNSKIDSLLSVNSLLSVDILALNAEVDSLTNANYQLAVDIIELNTQIDSLDLYYTDLSDAVTAMDTMLTYINNGVLNYIEALRIK